MADQLPEILRPKEAAQLLTLSLRTLYRLAETGAIGYVKVSEHGLRFYRQHVVAFLKERTFEPKKDAR